METLDPIGSQRRGYAVRLTIPPRNPGGSRWQRTCDEVPTLYRRASAKAPSCQGHALTEA